MYWSWRSCLRPERGSLLNEFLYLRYWDAFTYLPTYIKTNHKYSRQVISSRELAITWKARYTLVICNCPSMLPDVSVLGFDFVRIFFKAEFLKLFWNVNIFSCSLIENATSVIQIMVYEGGRLTQSVTRKKELKFQHDSIWPRVLNRSVKFDLMVNLTNSKSPVDSELGQ